MQSSEGTEDGEEDFLDRIREDPPRIDEPDMLEGVARFRLGNRMYVHEMEERDDGSYVGYLGVAMARDTTGGALNREITFLNYAPVGALIATPTGDGEYTVRLPGRDEIGAGIRARERAENAHRATVLPPLRNILDDAVDEHVAALDTTDDVYRAGVHAGMARMATIALRELSRRWSAPYSGEKRWETQMEESNG